MARRNLSPREREVLSLIGRESTIYRVIADLLDAVELEPPTLTATDIHGRAETRPATPDEVAGFHSELARASTSRRSPKTSPA